MKKLLFSLILFLAAQLRYGQETTKDTCKIEVPNTITLHSSPEGMDYHFKAFSNCEVKKVEFAVYNRWGETLFETKDFTEYWDASEQSNGVFVWKIEGKFDDGTAFNLTGNVTLLK